MSDLKKTTTRKKVKETTPVTGKSVIVQETFHVKPLDNKWVVKSSNAGVLRTYKSKLQAVVNAKRLAQQNNATVIVSGKIGSFSLSHSNADKSLLKALSHRKKARYVKPKTQGNKS